MKTLENPPPEKSTPTSEEPGPVVPPTEVTKGQPDGKVGMNVVPEVAWTPQTPPSPEAKRTDVHRAPSCM